MVEIPSRVILIILENLIMDFIWEPILVIFGLFSFLVFSGCSV